MQKPLKTLFLLEDLCYGGTQKQNLALAMRLDRERFSPALATLTGPTDLDEIAAAASVPVWHMGSSRRLAPFFFARLGRLLEAVKPDILVPCTALPNIWGRIWGRIRSVPLVVGTCRGGGAPWRQHERWLWRLCQGIVCNSRELVEVMADRGVDRERMVYIANGVDTEHFRPDSREKCSQLILCVARLAKDKDHRTLLSAFARIAPQFPDARLRLVGEGPEESALRNFCNNEIEPETAQKVEFAGPSADPAQHYKQADIFALSSIREGQPNSILEAMSAGLPVCATAVGGIPPLLAGNGLLSAAGDADAMAQNLALLLRDGDKAARLGRQGRQRAEADFSFAAMVRNHEGFFLKLWHKEGIKN